MGMTRKALAVLPATTATVAGLLAAQVLKAAHRPDLPSFPNQDPSGVFGDPELPRLRIVALGDSSITAPGVEDLDNVWIRRVARSFEREHHVEFFSLAVGGSKARDLVADQLDTAVRLTPDIAVVSVGANDAIRSPSPERYRTDLEHVVRSLVPVSGAIVMMGMGDLGSIPRLPWSLRRLLTERSKQYDAIASAIAARRPTVVKVYTRGRLSKVFWEDPSLFAGDLFHAGDTGHAVFAEEALPAFRAARLIAMARVGE